MSTVAVTSGSPRTVLYLEAGAGLYGSGVSLLEIASHLPRDRYRPLVALPEEGPLADALRARGVAVVAVPFGTLRRAFRPDQVAAIAWRNITGPRALARLIEEQSVSIVHTNSTHMLSGALAAGRTKRPHVVHLRENLLPPKLLTQAVMRFLWKRTDRAIAITRATAAELLGLRGDHPRLRIIHDAVDPAAFPPGGDPARARAKLGWDRAPHVGVVARLTPWKGHATFLHAAALIASQHPTVRFTIVGDADTTRNEAHKKRLGQLARQLGIASRVRWAGFVRPVQPLLAALDVLVVPSLRPEPFGIVIIEAMATERPVVATNHGGPPEILAHGGGVLVPPADASAMAVAVLGLLGDDNGRMAMGRVGRQEVITHFCIDAQVAAIAALYDGLLTADVAAEAPRGSFDHHRFRR